MVHTRGPQSGIRPHRLYSGWLYYPAAMVSVALIVLFVYLPVVGFPFFRDDVGFLADAATSDTFWNSVSEPINEHFIPLFRALLFTEFSIFGTNPVGYYWVTLAMHAVNACLVLLLYNLVTSDRAGALCAGILFGVSAAYWRAIMWISVQCNLLSVFCFLLATLLFILFLKKEKIWMLLLSSCFYFLMLMTRSEGVEIPVLFALLTLLVFRRNKQGTVSVPKLLLALFPYFTVIAVCFLLRDMFLPESESAVSAIGGVAGFMQKIPGVLSMLMGGIVQGYFRSFTGLYRVQLNACHLAIAFLVVFLLTDGSPSARKTRLPLLACMTAWLCLSYFTPIFFRASEGYWEIVTKPRYRYLPAFAAVTIAVLLFRSLRPFTDKNSRRIGVYACWALFACIICANVAENRRRERFVFERVHPFDIQVEEFVAAFHDLSRAHSPAPFGVLDKPFFDEVTGYAGWNVYPSQVVRLYLPPESYSATRFVSQYKAERDFPLYAYGPGGFKEAKED